MSLTSPLNIVSTFSILYIEDLDTLIKKPIFAKNVTHRVNFAQNMNEHFNSTKKCSQFHQHNKSSFSADFFLGCLKIQPKMQLQAAHAIWDYSIRGFDYS